MSQGWRTKVFIPKITIGEIQTPIPIGEIILELRLITTIGDPHITITDILPMVGILVLVLATLGVLHGTIGMATAHIGVMEAIIPLGTMATILITIGIILIMDIILLIMDITTDPFTNTEEVEHLVI
jgi:hypothetical protein